eukprot:TRINITY_DN30911_c0_g1_i1.p1 TRINITY_DN30911_c0_g1~~TRINITY_DN30911_c0_g1_i1.p1  ORF type:complete len:188 (+),score=72.18 TRINITY_DN30911_c0_g1_i1:2-565(+)
MVDTLFCCGEDISLSLVKLMCRLASYEVIEAVKSAVVHNMHSHVVELDESEDLELEQLEHIEQSKARDHHRGLVCARLAVRMLQSGVVDTEFITQLLHKVLYGDATTHRCSGDHQHRLCDSSMSLAADLLEGLAEAQEDVDPAYINIIRQNTHLLPFGARFLSRRLHGVTARFNNGVMSAERMMLNE